LGFEVRVVVIVRVRVLVLDWVGVRVRVWLGRVGVIVGVRAEFGVKFRHRLREGQSWGSGSTLILTLT
jgi:hypothetical protein